MGDTHTTVILSGITSAGPQGALEFLRSPESIRELARKLKAQGYDHIPPAIQVVVRCNLDHNLALSWDYATHIALQNSLYK